MVMRAICNREIAGSSRRRAEFAVMLCSWARPLPTRAPSRSRSESGYLVGPRRLVFVISYTRQNVWLTCCMLPGELRWLMNEWDPVTKGQLCKARRVALAVDTGLHLYLYLWWVAYLAMLVTWDGVDDGHASVTTALSTYIIIYVQNGAELVSLIIYSKSSGVR